ncbi:hypothetical protein ACK1CN_00585 [Vibrio coralliilyticus]|mgnify:CR=1 FL=1|jgi:hypothetical protein|uniref:Uncharacterized protein n=1 Tax=Vibrio coralliilyticus TaxID=190893 RepID=A0AAP6ZU84_9VIBR|nr:hypothetical protein [Vibrio coralliilyticus]NOJ24663.1 hypothetical protein [Vibrio coralliilyticus]NRF16623.1 hypothetical protein [Vibrio coralliilyticus]NRF25617.1 hypothetical protein [Vibrio coralliilyticus]NRF79756.1 hypothetical protein [Vibrio coralliilyticus]QIJ85163.1 hypothetical protein G3U99_13235 [Vibrio coralliilyticus OCN008]
MEIEIYMPCEPEWVCDSLLLLFALLFVSGLIGFIYIVYREYVKIQRASRVRERRKLPHSQRKKR